MKIVFIHSGISIDGGMLERGPLGGTETALIGVTRALARNPDVSVHVFANTPAAAVDHSVHYHPIGTLQGWSQQNDIDVLISIRQWIPFWLPMRARLRIYFSPDSYDQPFPKRAFDADFKIENKSVKMHFYPPEYFWDHVDHVFCVGSWQGRKLVEHLRYPAEKIFVTANGVFLENFSPLPMNERAPRLVYSSTPFRGLAYLTQYLPEIRKTLPQAGLEVCSGMGVYGVSADEDTQRYGSLYQAIQALGGISHGSLQQKELAKILCRNMIFAYPNTFEETFCIAVLEAQAAGLPVVTSKRAALMERVTDGEDGILIPGEPDTETYRHQFIQAVTALLSKPDLWQRFSSAAQKKAKNFTYDQLARQWLTVFDECLRNKTHTLPQMPKFQPMKLQHPDLTQTLEIGLELQHSLLQQAFGVYGFRI